MSSLSVFVPSFVVNLIDTSLTRRSFLSRTATGLMALGAGMSRVCANPSDGAIVGEPTGASAGRQMLADGGNAVDAVVAAALAACVVSIHNCGLGGYGGHMVIARPGRKVVAIDFNTMAPAAAWPEMFATDSAGAIIGRSNDTGWLAAAVPGTVAGLDLALRRYGTARFEDVAAPAIRLANDGFPLGAGAASAIHRTLALLREDRATARLFLVEGAPRKAGKPFRNPELGDLLTTLSRRNATEEFYRGGIATTIAEAFARGGGLVTKQDMAAYRARLVAPVEIAFNDLSVHTAPLTAGGLTIIQALAFLRAMDWDALPSGPRRTFLRLEALRQAWNDRLTLLGDPENVEVPVRRLLSTDYARERAGEIRVAVANGSPRAFSSNHQEHSGTVHLSAADRDGTMVALTLTHGNAFGARVTVDGLGLVLGHGMSRFDTSPAHPNAPGPRKRPLHNMCPTILKRNGVPMLAIGGAGGRKIPNSVFDVLTRHLFEGMPMPEAMAAPRWHTEGDLKLILEKTWPADQVEFLRQVGFTVENGGGALVSAVWRQGSDFRSGSR